MWRPTPEVEAFELRWLEEQPKDYRDNLRLWHVMYEHARKLGAFPLRDPRYGIEEKVRILRAIHGLRPDGGDRPGA